MAKKVSDQIAESMKSIRELITRQVNDSQTAFHLGIIWGELESAYNMSLEQEKSYESICALVVANNPEPVVKAIKRITKLMPSRQGGV